MTDIHGLHLLMNYTNTDQFDGPCSGYKDEIYYALYKSL